MSSDREPIETEIKLRAPPGAIEVLERHPALSGAPAEERREVTTYFDTPKLDLARRYCSLRIRQSDGRRVQTVKSARGDGVAAQRGEWEQPVETDTPDFALLAETPVGSALRGRAADELQPVLVTDIRRTTRLLRLDVETAVEAALDRGVISAAGRSEPVSELELELKQGNPGALYRLAIELTSAAPLTLEPASKAERGLRLSSGERPAPAKAPVVNFARDITAAEAFGTIVRSTLTHMLANVAAARIGDPEGVHQLRVAIRRLRAALVLFGRLLRRETTERFNEELRRMGRVFGAARDWDVFIGETLPGVEAEGAERGWLGLLRERAEQWRAAAQADVRRELDGPAFTTLLLGVAGWIEDGAGDPILLGDTSMGRPIAELAPALLGRMARKTFHRGKRLKGASREELHAFRKSIKKLRYGFEFLAPLCPPGKVEAAVDPCEKLQKWLGYLNDAAVTPALAGQLTEGHADLAPALGVLADWAEAHGKKALRRVPKHWRQLGQTELMQLGLQHAGGKHDGL
jgi:inorganic triphosphatase YgiF